MRTYLLAAVVLLGTAPAAPAHAQNLAGKTIVYTAVSGSVSGYIFVAPSGTVYWSAECGSCGFGGKNKGVRFRIGRSMTESHSGCQVTATGALSGGVLSMNAISTCTALQSTDNQSLTVTLSGESCSLVHTTRFNSPSTGPVNGTTRSESCRIVAGSQIAR